MVSLTSKTHPLLAIATLALILGLGGCRICADCEGLAYPAYGGAWQRTLRDSGRVGSIFDPGGARASSLVDRDEPDDPDEIERKKQRDRVGIADPDHAEDGPAQSEGDGKSDLEKADELRERKLDDIEGRGEDELRKRELDDIEVRILGGEPPVLINIE